MREKIIATDKKHLKSLIESEIKIYGNECDLNHINIYTIIDMSNLFSYSQFNGDISKWNVSSVTDMSFLFYRSEFNKKISSWDVSKVIEMNDLFHSSQFTGDLSNWRPLKTECTKYMFLGCKAPIPYWFSEKNKEIVKKIESYDLFNKINKELNGTENKVKKMKI